MTPISQSGTSTRSPQPAWAETGAAMDTDHSRRDLPPPRTVGRRQCLRPRTTAGKFVGRPRQAAGRLLWSQDISSYNQGCRAGPVPGTSPAIYGDDLILGRTAGSSVSGASRHIRPARRVRRQTAATGKPVWVDARWTLIRTPRFTGFPRLIYDGRSRTIGISSKGEGNSQGLVSAGAVHRGGTRPTGRLLWKTYTVPSNNGGGDSNKPGYYKRQRRVGNPLSPWTRGEGCCT